MPVAFDAPNRWHSTVCLLIAIWYPAWVAESVCRIYASLHVVIIRTTTGTGTILTDFKDDGPAGKQPASADRRPDHLKRMRACGAAAEAVCRLPSAVLRACGAAKAGRGGLRDAAGRHCPWAQLEQGRGLGWRADWKTGRQGAEGPGCSACLRLADLMATCARPACLQTVAPHLHFSR